MLTRKFELQKEENVIKSNTQRLSLSSLTKQTVLSCLSGVRRLRLDLVQDYYRAY